MKHLQRATEHGDNAQRYQSTDVMFKYCIDNATADVVHLQWYSHNKQRCQVPMRS